MPEAFGGPQVAELLEQVQEGDKVLFNDRKAASTTSSGAGCADRTSRTWDPSTTSRISLAMAGMRVTSEI